MMRLALLVGCLCSLASFAQTDGGADGGNDGGTDRGTGEVAPPPAPAPAASNGIHSIAILRLKGSTTTEAQTEPVTALIAAKLSEERKLRVVTEQDIAALIGLERQKELLGAECREGSSCFTELAGSIGAEFLVSGRLDRFGDTWTLTTTLFDAQKNQPLARSRTDAASEGELPAAAEKAALSVLAHLHEHANIGVAAPKPAAPAAKEDTGADIGIRLGTNFIEGISTLSPSGDLVLGYRFDPAWVASLQIGVTVVRDAEGRVNVLPTVLGLRHHYRIDKAIQPYWGVGLGVQLAIGPFGIFEQTGPLPSVLGMVGVTWFITRWFGIGLEGSTNLAQTILGLSRDAAGSGFNLKPSLSVTFRP